LFAAAVAAAHLAQKPDFVSTPWMLPQLHVAIDGEGLPASCGILRANLLVSRGRGLCLLEIKKSMESVVEN
jgi:hypothetical protein